MCMNPTTQKSMKRIQGPLLIKTACYMRLPCNFSVILLCSILPEDDGPNNGCLLSVAPLFPCGKDLARSGRQKITVTEAREF